MPELKSEESAAQRRNKSEQGWKILTPNQILSRLLISLAQLKVENSQKLKNEIRQILHSLHHSKKMTKSILTIRSTRFKNGNNLYEHQK